MSRNSVYSRSSYGSYRSSRYGRNRRDPGGKGKIIIIVCLCAALAAGVGACFYFGVFDRLFGGQTSEQSTPSEQSRPSASKGDASDSSEPASEESSETPESSAAPKKELTGTLDGNVFIYDKQGYEIYHGLPTVTDKYASLVAEAKAQLGSGVKVYDMTVPTHALFGLPEKYQAQGNDEREAIQSIYKKLGSDIVSIDVTDTLGAHQDEYIYFKTDSNWTGLGAYYAYTEFCKAAEVQPVSLSALTKGTIKPFQGSLTSATKTEKKPDGNPILAANPDSVVYYQIPGEYTCTLLENGESSPREVPLIATFASGSFAYSAFIWGDNPYMDIQTKLRTNRKLCIIKDSYGCAFAPFTVTNFDEVYVVDPRYYSGNVIEYIKKNHFTDVLFVNSLMTAATDMRNDDLKSVMK